MYDNSNNTRRSIGKQIKLPLRDAVKISLKNIRIRIGRSVITMAGIFLGIAVDLEAFLYQFPGQCRANDILNVVYRDRFVMA